MFDLLARLAVAGLLWAAPFVAAGLFLMVRAERRGELTTGRFIGLFLGMLGPLWLLGGAVCLLFLAGLPGPDAGLAASVGTAFAGVGATIVWTVSAAIGFAVLQAGTRGAGRP